MNKWEVGGLPLIIMLICTTLDHPPCIVECYSYLYSVCEWWGMYVCMYVYSLASISGVTHKLELLYTLGKG